MALLVLTSCSEIIKCDIHKKPKGIEKVDSITIKKILWNNEVNGLMISNKLLILMPCMFFIKDTTIDKVECFENGPNDSRVIELSKITKDIISTNVEVLDSSIEVYSRDYDSLRIYGTFGKINPGICEFGLVDLVLLPSSDTNTSICENRVSMISARLRADYNSMNLCLAILKNLNFQPVSSNNSVKIKYYTYKNGIKKNNEILKTKADLSLYIYILNYFVSEKYLN
jgi:hypothetical protein